jgi:hypothetical protein
MKTHGLTTKTRAKKPKNVRNCESWANFMKGATSELFDDLVVNVERLLLVVVEEMNSDREPRGRFNSCLGR